jgi:two-component system chemotaxis response regulator CheB
VNPDVVILDVEMAEMDGIETLREIRKTYPDLPVIMFSAHTEKGASITIDALLLGATDYVTKPSNAGSLEAALDLVRQTLIPKIKQFSPRIGPLPVIKAAPEAGTPMTGARKAPSDRIEIVAIGISTGGPNALAAMLPGIPADLPVPIVIVQHMPPLFTKTLAERLDLSCGIQVREAQGGEVLTPGCAWIAPGGFHLTLERTADGVVLRTNLEPPENSLRPAVDVTFRSVASVYGGECLAVVMTGMGHDGTRGCEHIVDQGGRVIVQDEASSVVWAMPQAVVEAGLAEEIVKLESLAEAITSRVTKGRRSPLGAVLLEGK